MRGVDVSSMSGRARPSPRPLFAALSASGLTGLVLAFWLGFAPTSVGGDYSYAVVRGNSMEPGLQNGDIVFLRRDTTYSLGDVVAYRDPQIGPVLHRIVARQEGHFTIRGDNRDHNDPYQPLPADVIGRSVGTWHGGLRAVVTATAWPSLAMLALVVIAFGISGQLRAPGTRPPFAARGRRGGAPGYARRATFRGSR
jgi:signal peptidase I